MNAPSKENIWAGVKKAAKSAPDWADVGIVVAVAPPPIGIGSTIWEYIEYRRAPDDPRQKWEPRTITGETSRSWIIGRSQWDERKVPKKGPHYGWVFSENELDDRIWLDAHKYKIIRFVEKAIKENTPLARKIAELIGYNENPN